jgi:hypothetical protein
MAIQDGSILQMAFSYVGPYTSLIQNVFHFRVDTSAPTAESLCMVAGLNAIDDLYSEIDQFLDDGCSGFFMRLDELEWNAVAGRWDVFRNLGEAGVTSVSPAETGEPLPPGVSALLQAVPIYRKHSGFKYLGGFTETYNNAQGKVHASLVSGVLAFGIELYTHAWTVESGVATMQYVILDRSGPYHYEPYAVIAKSAWSYQRRRKQLVGL